MLKIKPYKKCKTLNQKTVKKIQTKIRFLKNFYNNSDESLQLSTNFGCTLKSIKVG